LEPSLTHVAIRARHNNLHDFNFNNSVLQSGFPGATKRRWLGARYDRGAKDPRLPGASRDQNDADKVGTTALSASVLNSCTATLSYFHTFTRLKEQVVLLWLLYFVLLLYHRPGGIIILPVLTANAGQTNVPDIRVGFRAALLAGEKQHWRLGDGGAVRHASQVRARARVCVCEREKEREREQERKREWESERERRRHANREGAGA
jgi:hypothetical protein